MAKLRHIAIAVEDVEATAKFYQQAFGMTQVRQSPRSILMTDGTVSLAILDNQKNHEALGAHGLHHFGVIAEDVEETAARAEAGGARYADSEENIARRYANRGQMQNGEIAVAARAQAQHKYVDPNGIKFDIVNNLHARNSWKLDV